jgi:nitric oxide reductase subunit B
MPTDSRAHWWKVFVLIFVVSIAVVGYLGYKTYEYAPPVADFVTEDGEVVASAQDIQRGQEVFLRYGLMEYGSFLGDGGLRGPDFTAEALHQTAAAMTRFYEAQKTATLAGESPETRAHVVRSIVQDELKRNRYHPRFYEARRRQTPDVGAPGAILLSAAQADAFRTLRVYYGQKFGSGGDLVGVERFKPAGYITDAASLDALTAFFYWGGWLSAAERPGFSYSYTHNWPYDPAAGNQPHGGLVLWSVIGVLVVVLSIGFIFFQYGRLTADAPADRAAEMAPYASASVVEGFRPTATQRATYKFFAVAAVLFLLQVLAGLLAISDFINLFAYLGIDLSAIVPVTVSRGWHSQMSILWIAVCWFAAAIWVLPAMSRPEPAGQRGLVNLLFAMLVVVALGTALGIPLGISGALDADGAWRWFGLQGWEFMQIGRLYQYVLFAAFVLWFVIVLRGVWPLLKRRQSWSLPNWMVYAIGGIILMFSAAFVARPDTNFVVADFWRWATIHMWVEAFFELFTTILVAYFLYLMGFVTHAAAARVVYLAAVLFLGSGLIGISHNFYWNAKSIETVALGGVLSSLQVAPLVLLTIEAFRFQRLPKDTAPPRVNLESGAPSAAAFGLSDAFAFLIAVNFWNFYGAGVLGFAINLPIVNYYQHGTYLTVNHAHAALFGVYGNLAIAAMLFCSRWAVGAARWNSRPLRVSFWSLNVGLALMVVMDLFPVGVHQLMAVLRDGYAFARSQAYLEGSVFQTFTWLRGVGVTIFITGGVLPLVWFMVTRWFSLKPAETEAEARVAPGSVLAEL